MNQMRAELDIKQRDILEQRLLLEELMASSSGIATADVNSPSYDQAHKAVEQFFEQLHQPLRSERDRLEAKSSELARRQEQFRKDRTELEQWFTEQERILAEKMSKDHSAQDAARIASLEEQLSTVRTQWHQERREAEEAIRDLLEQVAESEAQSFRAVQSARTDSEDDQRSAA